MKKIITAVIVLAVLAGCNMSSVPEAKKEAYKRWYNTRARMLCSVAEEHLKVGQLKKAHNRAMEALSLDKDLNEARIVLAKVCIEQGEYDTAIAELTTVQEAAPASSEVYYLLGVALEKRGRYEEALQSYRHAYAIDDSNISPVIAAAEVLVAMNRVQEAQLYIESYMVRAYDDPGMYEIAGRLAMMRNQYDKAADYFEQASDLDCRNVRYREALGRARFFSGNYRKALSVFEGLEEEKDYVAQAWLYTMQGDCCMALGRMQDALALYQQASRLDKTSPGIWTSMAKAAMALNDAPRAILSARQALQLDANSLDAVIILGYALLKNHQTTRAISVLTQATSVHPDSSIIYCVLGMAHAQGGDFELASKCYSRALSIEPDNQLAKTLVEGGATRLSKTN